MGNVSRLPERPLTNWELAAQLCSWSPHLREARRVHIERHGNLIPHFFMADVLARIGACQHAFTDPQAKERGELEAILGILERGAENGDREARSVIALSFLDDARSEPFFAALWPLLGPKLKAQAQSRGDGAP